MISLSLALAMVPQVRAPQLRTNLPSGAVILAENLPTAKSISVQLFAASRGVEEAPARHGWRHLLEHLTLKGRDPKNLLDVRVEAKGMFIQGRTFRDFMQFEVTGHVGSVDDALSVLREVTQPLEVSAEDIAKEVTVMKEEFALTEDSVRLGAGAWSAAYSASGLDAQGDLEAMARATPGDLADLQAKHFAPKNFVLVVSGPLDPDAVTAKCAAFLASFRGDTGVAMERPEGNGGRATVDGAFGEGRAVPVGPFATTETMAILVGAFGVAAKHESAFMTYTPTMTRGLVVVGQTESNGGIGRMIDDFAESDVAQVFVVGRNLTRRWVANHLATPSGSAYLWGSLLVHKPDARIDSIKEALDGLTFEKFKREFGRFKREKAVTVVGAGS